MATFTKSGSKATSEFKLPKTVFGLEVKNHELLKQAYMAFQANKRQNLAKVKTRGEVRGGGKKPWRQKGTGRARFGSSRVPIWRGGGITFGPTGNENYSIDMPVNSKRLALKQALSLKAKDISVLETFECKDGKVAETVRLLDKLDVKGKTLLVVPVKDDLVKRATNNIANLKVVQANYLNVYDILNAGTIVISEKAVSKITEWLNGTAKPEAKS